MRPRRRSTGLTDPTVHGKTDSGAAFIRTLRRAADEAERLCARQQELVLRLALLSRAARVLALVIALVRAARGRLLAVLTLLRVRLALTGLLVHVSRVVAVVRLLLLSLFGAALPLVVGERLVLGRRTGPAWHRLLTARLSRLGCTGIIGMLLWVVWIHHCLLSPFLEMTQESD